MDKIKQFFSLDRYAALSGIELISVAEGKSLAQMRLGPQHWNGLGSVHGGAIFTLADFAFAAAANSYGTLAVAINANITIMKAASTGTLHARATEVSKNFKLGTYTVEVTDDQGDLIALFQGMAYRKGDKLPLD
jgi:acyl-CoA thioesterase